MVVRTIGEKAMSTGFIILFIAWAITTVENIFLLWYLQKHIWRKEKQIEEL